MIKNFVKAIEVEYNGIDCMLTVGQFADETHQLWLCLENKEDWEFVETCNLESSQTDADEIMTLSDEMTNALILAGVVKCPHRFLGGFPVSRLTEKAKEYISELEKDNSEIYCG